jgi:outer membrane protein assembly factor BamA
LKKYKYKIQTINIFFALLAILTLDSCSSTKLVKGDQHLLNKQTITTDNPSITEKELSASLKQKPNRKTLGLFRLHLATYNFTHPKDTSKHFPKFFTRIGEVIGEPPVIYYSSLQLKSHKNLENYLQRKGYYEAVINDTLIINEKHPKKAELSFSVKTGKVYNVGKLKYDIIDPFIKDVVFSDTIHSLVKENMVFDLDILQSEINRIQKQMKNEGYYYFSKQNIHFYADTTNQAYNVDLTLTVKKSFDADRYFLEEIFTKQKIKDVFFYINFNQGRFSVEKEAYLQTLDTINYKGYTFLVDGNLKIKPDVILQANYIKPDDFYSLENTSQTQKHLSSIKQFKSISIQFTEVEDYRREVWNAENPYLNAHVFLSSLNRQSYELVAEGTNSSNSFGLTGVVSYQNRNLLKGAEIFSSKLTGSLQTISGEEDLEDRFLNTFEIGGEIKLDVPKLFLPFQKERFVKEHDPGTSFKIAINHQDRQDYTRTLGNVSFGYSWNSKNNNFHHKFNPMEYYVVKIFDFDPSFEEQIDSLYIKYSFEDQLITAMSWNTTYNNQNIKKAGNHWYIWTNIETSGNIMSLLGSSLNLPVSDDDSYKIFDLEFAQYIKTDIDVRFYQQINKNSNIVYRTFIGAGIPFGNSKTGLPFVKKYYIGGANDIRAWQVRTLGPGSYSGGSLFNQIADMKLLFNIEYRFDLISIVKGALFIDAGNIWAIDKADNREGALFELNSFYKEIAIGTGVGIRFDISIFVLRFDFGIPLYDPAYPENERWLSRFDELNLNDFTLNFGIGYPF